MKFLPLLILGIFTACNGPDPRTDNYELNKELFKEGKKFTRMTDQRLMEASGLAASQRNPGMFWSHNDSGGVPAIFLINKKGLIEFLAVLNDATNVDWEDIAVVDSSIYIGDIGDNTGSRKNVVIYKVDEPDISKIKPSAINIDAEKMTVNYENGARDSETLLYDHSMGELILVTKRERNCLVYSFPFEAGSTATISPKGKIALKEFTAGDSNEKGEILLRNYYSVFYWGPSQESAASRISRGPDYVIPCIEEAQGESICFDVQGNFYTFSEYSEHEHQNIWIYERR